MTIVPASLNIERPSIADNDSIDLTAALETTISNLLNKLACWRP